MVWGLDKVFWWFAARTSNGKSKNKGNRWVVAPFGLHSGLQQSGSRCAAGLERPKAEALGYPEAKTKAKEEQAKARTGKSKGEIQGSLHCAMDGEAVHSFGRDDVWVVFVSGSAEVAAVVDGVLAAEDAGYGLGVGEVLLLEDAG